MRHSLSSKLSIAAISALLLIASPNAGVAHPCSDLASKLKGAISALVGKSSEQIQIEIASVKEELHQVNQDYVDLNNYIRSLGRISATGRAAQIARKHLSTKLKELYQLQKKRYRLEKKYFTTPMQDKFVGEVIGVEWTNQFREMGAGIHYIEPSKRDAFRVDILRTGKLMDSTGKPLNGRLLFVMDQDGNIYAATPYLQFPNGRFLRHSSFLDGAPVASAGEIVVKNGKLELVNRKSGHYLPSKKANDQFLSLLQERGVNISAVEVGGGF